MPDPHGFQIQEDSRYAFTSRTKEIRNERVYNPKKQGICPRGVQKLPFYPNDVKGALQQALIPTLEEAGCEGMFETSREGDPHKLVFFEIFSSSAAHEFHLEQDYMKRLFRALEGKLARASIMTKLNAL